MSSKNLPINCKPEGSTKNTPANKIIINLRYLYLTKIEIRTTVKIIAKIEPFNRSPTIIMASMHHINKAATKTKIAQ